MKLGKIDILLLIVPVVLLVLLIPVLPARIPIHFDFSGHADGYISKNYAFLLGVIPFLIFESIKRKYGRR